MKIILTQEVTGLGSPGDMVEVKDGYGRNFLLPQSKAILATRGAEKQVADIKRARQARAAKDLGHAREIAQKLSAVRVRIVARAGSDRRRLFGSITGADVAEAVAAAGGPQLDRRSIVIDGHIKTTGKYQASVRLHPEVAPTFNIEVVASKS